MRESGTALLDMATRQGLVMFVLTKGEHASLKWLLF